MTASDRSTGVVGRVPEVDVDAPESLEALRELPFDVLGGEVDAAGAVGFADEPDFRRDDHVGGVALVQPSSDGLLALASAVRVGGVDDRDAEFARLVETLDALVGGEAETAGGRRGSDASDRARAEDELADLDAGRAEGDSAHGALLSMSGASLGRPLG